MLAQSRLRLTAALTAFAMAAAGLAQAQVTTPREHFGFDIGDDYHLATYTQLESYVRKLADESPRMVVEEIGQTSEGRPQVMAIITSPENHQNLARYKEISRRLALAEGLTDREMDRLRVRTHTGRPLGSDRFLSKLETVLGRRVRRLPVGRPRKTPKPVTEQKRREKK